MAQGHKMIKDCIYGHIKIPSLCVKFMDVPEFQRLRRVRQLGVVHYAYPSAVHTRFEHSLGVMHFAGKMVDQLRNYVDISERRKELIQLAGMYHDIGHFAYSHLFDVFLAKANIVEPPIMKIHDHEDRSLYFLRKVNSRLKLLDTVEENFVANAIEGIVREGEPAYQYQIVCNKECGVDVDKLDFLHRDSYHTGFPQFQGDYILLSATVPISGHLAFKRKAYEDLKDLFEVRRRLFACVYKHHTAVKIDKIHYCMMKRMGSKLFQYGERTDDYNIETLFRNSPETADLIQAIETRDIEHECSICQEYQPGKVVKKSGQVEDVRFI